MNGQSVTIKILRDYEAKSGRLFHEGQYVTAIYYAKALGQGPYAMVGRIDGQKSWLHGAEDPIFKVMTPLELLADQAE